MAFYIDTVKKTHYSGHTKENWNETRPEPQKMHSSGNRKTLQRKEKHLNSCVKKMPHGKKSQEESGYRGEAHPLRASLV